MTRRYITIAEAAEYLKISDHTVRRLIADGELTGYRIGRSHRMIRVDLDEIDEKLMLPFGGVVWRQNPTGLTPRSRARLRNAQIRQTSSRRSHNLTDEEVVATGPHLLGRRCCSEPVRFPWRAGLLSGQSPLEVRQTRR